VSEARDFMILGWGALADYDFNSVDREMSDEFDRRARNSLGEGYSVAEYLSAFAEDRIKYTSSKRDTTLRLSGFYDGIFRALPGERSYDEFVESIPGLTVGWLDLKGVDLTDTYAIASALDGFQFTSELLDLFRDHRSDLFTSELLVTCEILLDRENGDE